MLQKTDIQVPLGTGIETKTDAKLVAMGKLVVSENSNIDQKNGSSYKRFGHDALSNVTYAKGNQFFDDGILENVQRVSTLGSELVAITNKSLYGYNESEQKWAWKGYCGNVLAETDAVFRDAKNAIRSDHATANGITVVVTLSDATETNIVITVLDAKTKNVIRQQFKQSIGLATNPGYFFVKAKALGDIIYVYYIAGATKLMYVVTVDTNTPDIINNEADVDGVVTTELFDVAVINSKIVILKAETGNSFQVRMAYAKPDGTVGGIADGLPADPVTVDTLSPGGALVANALSVTGDSSNIFVFYASNINSGVLSHKKYNFAFTQLAVNTLPTQSLASMESVVSITDNLGGVFVFYSIKKNNGVGIFPYVTLCYQVDSSNSVNIWAKDTYNCSIYSKPFYDSLGELYFVGMNARFGTEQKCYFVMRVNRFPNTTAARKLFPVCQMLVNEGLDDSYISRYFNEVELVNGVDISITLQRAFSITQSPRTDPSVGFVIGKSNHLTAMTTLRINSKDGYQVLQKEGYLYVTGGILFVYDGNLVFENGFLCYPYINSLDFIASAGNVPVGANSYQATYEWADRLGNKHISAPSLNKIVNIAISPKPVAAQILSLPFSYKEQTASFAVRNPGGVLYRAGLNTTVKYKVSSVSPEPFDNTYVDYRFNPPQDNLNDTDLKTKEIIYTNGGVIENISTGSGASIEDYQGRILLSNREDGNTILFSKQKRPTLAFQFNPDLLFTVRESSSRVKAAKVLDDKVILFKETSLYVQAGQGPTDTGENSDYLQNPQRISSNVGCPYPRSIVRYNDGIIFKSNDGFYKLDRSLSLTPIGDPVTYFNNLTVTDGILMEGRNEIRWTHSDGICLVYDYFQEQWYVYSNHESNSCTVWNEKFVMAKTDGQVWVEDKTSQLDAGTAVSRRIVTPWFAMAGLQHAQRIYRIKLLGEMRSPHNLIVKVSYDYEPAVRETFEFNSLTALGNVTLADNAYYTVPPTYSGQDRTYDIEIRPSIQKCESFRLELIDVPLESGGDPIDGGCAVWTSLTMTVGTKPSTLRSSSNRRSEPQ